MNKLFLALLATSFFAHAQSGVRTLDDLKYELDKKTDELSAKIDLIMALAQNPAVCTQGSAKFRYVGKTMEKARHDAEFSCRVSWSDKSKSHEREKAECISSIQCYKSWIGEEQPVKKGRK